MSLQLVANHLAQKGRGPDSNLVHMSNREVAGLQALAKRHGGSLSVNPDTGLPEAGFLDNILPTIAGAGLSYFSGGTISPLMAAGIVGGISALDSKDLSKGLMAGLGAYGGAGLTQGFMGAGLGAVGPELSAQAAADATSQGLTGEAYNQAVQNQVASGLAEKNLAAEGVSQLFANPGQTLETIGGGSGYKAAGILGAAAAPMLADEMVETTTEAPEQSRGMIRPYTYSRQQVPQDYQGQQGNMGSKERRYFNEGYTAGDPYAAAGGGLVALASGGYTNQNIFRPTTPLPENNMYGASRDAYDYLMGVNPTSGGGQTRPYDPNYPINDIRIDDGKNLNPNTPKTGKGRYEFDPVTRQYKWVPDPITPVDVAAPVFENPMQAGGGGGGYGTTPEGRAEREARMDKLRAELGEEGYAKRNDWIGDMFSNSTFGVAGKLIGKGVNAVQTYYRENELKDIYAKEAEKNEADRLKAESDNLLRMIQETNQSIYSPPVGSRTAPVTPESEQVQQAIADTDFSGMDRNNFAGTGGREGMFSGSGSAEGSSTAPAPGATNTQGSDGVGGWGSRDAGGGAPAPSAPAPSAPAPSAPAPSAPSGGGGGGGGSRDAGGERGYSGNNSGDNRGWGSRDAGGGDARGGYLQHGRFDQRMAHGGIANLHQYNLGSYSDGGRLLKGPGDGVSDDIPATIGRGQPARLADGEFVIPARIVSELGNGSTDAGARELYKMMDRIQAGRRKTVGKKQVAKNSKAVRHLPA